jgi:hypothetical protein
MKVHGSCHCGAIRFEADADPAKAGVCHCSDCQSLTGSAFALYLQVPRESFRLTAGQPKTYVKTAESGNRRAQVFCADCGSRLWASAEKDVWCRSALPWINELGRVPGKAQGA